MAFDMERAVAKTLETMKDYAALLEGETASVRGGRTAEVKAVGERKEKLANQLEVLLSGLRGDRARFAEHVRARPGLREDMQALWQRLSAAAAENAEALQQAIGTTRKVVDLVVEVARRTQQVRNGYAAAGYGRKGRSGHAPAGGLSVALDTSL